MCVTCVDIAFEHSYLRGAVSGQREYVDIDYVFLTTLGYMISIDGPMWFSREKV